MNSIRISAAIIANHAGETLLVRKKGTQAFMQAGGKIDGNESPRVALERELIEELSCTVAGEPRYLGQYKAVAANEADTEVIAELFAVDLESEPQTSGEIEKCIWVTPAEARLLVLAPLTRDHVLSILETML